MNRKAFTLIELLVVVAIIGILAAVGVVAYNGYTKSAKENAVRNNLKSVVKYINNELMKCELGELKIAGGRLNCPPDAFGLGVYTKFIEPFRNGEHIFRNPYDNGLHQLLRLQTFLLVDQLHHMLLLLKLHEVIVNLPHSTCYLTFVCSP